MYFGMIIGQFELIFFLTYLLLNCFQEAISGLLQLSLISGTKFGKGEVDSSVLKDGKSKFHVDIAAELLMLPLFVHVLYSMLARMTIDTYYM
jgi:hypothetical protein